MSAAPLAGRDIVPVKVDGRQLDRARAGRDQGQLLLQGADDPGGVGLILAGRLIRIGLPAGWHRNFEFRQMGGRQAGRPQHQGPRGRFADPQRRWVLLPVVLQGQVAGRQPGAAAEVGGFRLDPDIERRGKTPDLLQGVAEGIEPGAGAGHLGVELQFGQMEGSRLLRKEGVAPLDDLIEVAVAAGFEAAVLADLLDLGLDPLRLRLAEARLGEIDPVQQAYGQQHLGADQRLLGLRLGFQQQGRGAGLGRGGLLADLDRQRRRAVGCRNRGPGFPAPRYGAASGSG